MIKRDVNFTTAALPEAMQATRQQRLQMNKRENCPSRILDPLKIPFTN